MKKMLKYVASTLVITTLMTSSVFAKTTNAKIVVNSVDVLVNGQRIDSDNLVYNGTTYLPLRAVSESIGMEVAFDAETQEINLNSGKSKKIKVKEHKGETTTKNINVEVDSLEINVDGESVDCDNIVINGVTYLPLRAISEATGAEVMYDSAKKVVYLYTEDYEGEKATINNNASKNITSGSAVTVTKPENKEAVEGILEETEKETVEETKDTQETNKNTNNKNKNNKNKNGKGNK